MDTPAPIEKRSLPTLDDLYGNKVMAAKLNDLNRLLNADPKKEWIEDHPFATREIERDGQKITVPVKYIPIGVIEYIMTSIFIKWRVEVKEVKIIANACVTTIRLHYLNPISNDWDWMDGVGAMGIQVKKGASASDFENIHFDAVMKAAPASETYAIKDAAEKLGRIFGKDLNRENFSDYRNLEKKFSNELPAELKQQIKETSDTDTLADIFSAHPEYHLNREFMKILNAKRIELNKNANASTAAHNS